MADDDVYIEKVTDQGVSYFVNVMTQQSVWELPPGATLHKLPGTGADDGASSAASSSDDDDDDDDEGDVGAGMGGGAAASAGPALAPPPPPAAAFNPPPPPAAPGRPPPAPLALDAGGARAGVTVEMTGMGASQMSPASGAIPGVGTGWAGPVVANVGGLADGSKVPADANAWEQRRLPDDSVVYRNRAGVLAKKLPASGVGGSALECKAGTLGNAPEIGTADHKHMSLGTLNEYVNTMHPRRRVKTADGGTESRQFSVWGANTGWHWLGRYSKSDFIEYGVGISLYFKFLKFMSIVFFQLLALSLPMLIFYRSAGTFKPVTPLDELGTYTLGNIGEGKTVCQSAFENDLMYVGCPEGQTIGKLDVWYGQPTGSCECPADRVPEPECPGSVAPSGDTCANGGYCFLAESRTALLPDLQSFDSGACCANRLVDFAPDLSDLDFVVPNGCNAPAAQHIIEGRCLGQAACNFTVAGYTNMSWVLDTSLGMSSVCPGQAAAEREAQARVAEETGGTASTAALVCSDNLASQGGLDSCDATAPNRMVMVAKCFDPNVAVFGFTLRKTDVALLVGVFDFLGVLTFLVSVLWLRSKELVEVDKFDDKNITAGDYSVFFPWLPPHSSVAELRTQLKAHLETALSGCTPTWDGESEEERATHRAVADVKVADINFGLNIGRILHLLKKRGGLLRRLDALRKEAVIKEAKKELQEAEDAAEEGRAPKASPKSSSLELADEWLDTSGVKDRKKKNKLDKIIASIKTLDAKLDLIESLQVPVRDDYDDDEDYEAAKAAQKAKQTKKATPVRAVSAFVTFEEEEGYLRCIQEYMAHPLIILLQSTKLRFQGRRLSCVPAPEPSDIVWENLEVGGCSRALRSTVTTLISVFVVFLSAVLAFWSEDSKQTALRQFPTAECESLLQVSNATLVVQDEMYEAFNLTDGKTGRLECFCKDLLATAGPQELFRFQFDVPELASGASDAPGWALLPGAARWTQQPMCSTWLSTFTQVSALTYGGAVAVLLINTLLKTMLKVLVRWERRPSITDELTSRFLKLFVVQLLNTAFVVLLVNARFNMDAAGVPGLGKGRYDDFDAQWYAVVGGAITLTMILNIFIPHAAPFGMAMLLKLNRCRDRGCSNNYAMSKRTTQRQLHLLYTGREMQIAERYAQCLMVIFVTMTYSAGIPLLYGVALVFFISTYWVDKYLFVTSYRTPPSYTNSFAEATVAVMPIGVILHLGFAVWMLGNSNVIQKTAADEGITASLGAQSQALSGGVLTGLSSDGGFNASERVASPHTVPLFALAVIIVWVLVWLKIVVPIIKKFRRTLCGCCAKCCVSGPDYEDLPNYFDVIPMKTLLQVEKETRSGNPSVAPDVAKKYRAALEREAQAMGNTVDKMVANARPLRNARRKSITVNPALLAATPSGKSAAAAKAHRDRSGEMIGIVSYDMNANPLYRSAFGLDTEVPQSMKRGLTVGRKKGAKSGGQRFFPAGGNGESKAHR